MAVGIGTFLRFSSGLYPLTGACQGGQGTMEIAWIVSTYKMVRLVPL